MKLAISEATTMPASFAEDVAAAAGGGWVGLEVWLTKLEKHLETESATSTKSLIADKNIQLVAAAYQGGLLLSQGDARKAHFDHFRRRLEICEALSIPTMLLVADFTRTIEATDLERAVVSLAQAAQWAAGFGVKLGLEFRAGNTFCSSLDTAIRIVEACGEPNVGVCLDVLHMMAGPSKLEDLTLLTPANLAHVQLCDVLCVPREMVSDSDRIFPGDGDWPLWEITRRIQAIGYNQWWSLELMNPTFWQTKPTQVAELGLAAMKRTCKEAN